MSVQLDDHAVRMLHLVARPIVDIVHDGDIDEAAKALDRYDAPQLRQIAVLLAAMVDPAIPAEQALAWWTTRPAHVVPEHADEWYGDAPPMRRSHAVEALIEERYGPGRRRR